MEKMNERQERAVQLIGLIITSQQEGNGKPSSLDVSADDWEIINDALKEWVYA